MPGVSSGRSSDRGQIDVEHEMPGNGQRCRHATRRLQLASMHLSVAERERAQLITARGRDGRGGVGIEAATEEHDGSGHTGRIQNPESRI